MYRVIAMKGQERSKALLETIEEAVRWVERYEELGWQEMYIALVEDGDNEEQDDESSYEGGVTTSQITIRVRRDGFGAEACTGDDAQRVVISSDPGRDAAIVSAFDRVVGTVQRRQSSYGMDAERKRHQRSASSRRQDGAPYEHLAYVRDSESTDSRGSDAQ